MYSFDTRYLKNPVNVHVGHQAPVMDIDYSPTGKEIVSGAYDRTLRIFPVEGSNARWVDFGLCVCYQLSHSLRCWALTLDYLTLEAIDQVLCDSRLFLPVSDVSVITYVEVRGLRLTLFQAGSVYNSGVFQGDLPHEAYGRSAECCVVDGQQIRALRLERDEHSCVEGEGGREDWTGQ